MHSCSSAMDSTIWFITGISLERPDWAWRSRIRFGKMESRKAFTDEDRQCVIERDAFRYRQYGHSEKSLGWGEKGRQSLRYQVLAENWDLSDKVVLDIGAGFGDFYQQLQSSVKGYIGLELLEEFVKQGNELYGKNKNFSLTQADVSELDPFPECDVAFISGLFNFKLLKGENYIFIEEILRKAFDASKVGVAANFITDRVDFMDPLIFYSSPESILKIVLGMTKRYAISQSYFPFEFSVFLHKDDAFDKSKALFMNIAER